MKLPVRIHQIRGAILLRCAAHRIHRFLQFGDAGVPSGRQPRRQSFHCAAKLIQLQNILLVQADDACASAGDLGDEAFLRQQVDGLANGSLRDTEFSTPRALDDSRPWRQCSAADLVTETLREG